MSSKRRLRKKRCEGKARYHQAGAIEAAGMGRRVRHVELTAYQCPHCHWWHVGHAKGSLKRRVGLE